jgi:hypothetical protein
MLRLIKLLQTAANSSSSSSSKLQPLCAMLCLGFAPVSTTEASTAVQHWRAVRDTGPSQLKALSLTLQHTFAERCVTVRRTAAAGSHTTGAAAAVALSAASSGNSGSSSSCVNICVVSVSSRAAVLPTVLSAYVQQGRLPQPQEVLLCTEHTTQEDVALLLRRCVRAATAGTVSAQAAAVHGPDSEGGYEETKECEPPTTNSSSANTCSNSSSSADSSQYESLFCIADAQALSYSAQVALVRAVQTAVADTAAAVGGQGATLLIVSEPKQVVLSMLSAHAVELQPLSRELLAAACGPALLASCCGANSRAVLSEINGGGKSHRIMQLVGQWQAQQQQQHQQEQQQFTYHRIPLREEASAASLVAALTAAQLESAAVAAAGRSSSSGNGSMAVHLDIGHVVLDNAATLLFQLLVLGVLRDPVTSAVYSLYATDVTTAASQCTLLLEVPNSEGNAVAAALAAVCSLLPTEVLQVTAAALSEQRPERSLHCPTTVKLQVDAELHRACVWLRAATQPALAPAFESCTAAAMPGADSFALLVQHVCGAAHGPCQQPSWSLLCTLARHLAVQFAAMECYLLLQDVALQGMPGLESFRLAFARLLIATGKAFTLRALPQSEGTAVKSDAPWAAAASITVSGSGSDSGSGSGSQSEAAAAVVQRFKRIAAWEDSDHPLVLFKQGLPFPYGDGEVSTLYAYTLYYTLIYHAVMRATVDFCQVL